jgi:outer membrane protein assembly factor BamB
LFLPLQDYSLSKEPLLVRIGYQGGKEVWRQKLTDSPQGYLVASNDHLYIPTGRSNPIALDLKDGSFIKRFTGVGGTFSVVTDEALIAGRGNDGTLSVSDTQSTERIVEVRGTQLAVTPQYSVFYKYPFLTVLDRKRYFKINRKIKQHTVKLNSLRE